MATKKDFYEVLGLSKSASADDIKKAYRSLARKHHPDVDKTAGADGRFKEISEAYQVLADPERKKAYDQFGHDAFSRGAGSGAAGGNPFSGGGFGGTYTGGFEDPFTIFEQFFGGASAGRSRTRNSGDDLHYELTIDFKDAIFGSSRSISLAREVVCPVCSGSGAEKGSKVETCPQCQGSGQVVRVSNSIFGQIQTAAVCPTCRGTGKKISTPCSRCRGEGKIKQTTQQQISIPDGISDGDTIRFPGLGDAGGQGRPSGDLYLTIRVLPNKQFRRRGNDIYTSIDIPIPVAVLGGTIEVPTLTKTVELKIPAGTQTGTEFRLRGYGVPNRGDEYVQVNLKTPAKLSREEREHWERLAS